LWRVAVKLLNKQTRTKDNGWSSSSGAGRQAIFTVKEKLVNNEYRRRLEEKKDGV
jgi:hypothetical protein